MNGNHASSSGMEEVVTTLTAENRMLKERLVELGIRVDSSAISDAEKELLLSRNKASSAPPSIIGNVSESVIHVTKACIDFFDYLIKTISLTGSYCIWDAAEGSRSNQLYRVRESKCRI